MITNLPNNTPDLSLSVPISIAGCNPTDPLGATLRLWLDSIISSTRSNGVVRKGYFDVDDSGGVSILEILCLLPNL